MKIKLSRYIHSLSTKLSFCVLFVVTLVFVLGFVWNYVTSREAVSNEVVKRVRTALDGTVIKIDNVLNSVETAVNGMSWVVVENCKDPDKLYRITRMMLVDNPFICGCAVAFAPNHFKDKGLFFSPYSYRVGDSICSKQLGNETYDYHHDDWYQIPKLIGKPYWSEPYFDEGGADVMMTTYSCPLYDKDGNLFAVFTADVSLDWFAEQVNCIRPYENSYNIMISRGGTFLVHREKDVVLNQTFFISSMAMSDNRFKEVGHRMVRGESGVATFKRDGHEFYFVYAPIKTTNWSVAVSCLKSEAFAGVDSMRNSMFWIALTVLCIMAVLCYVIIFRLLAPLMQFAKMANGIAHGNFSAKLPRVKSKGEMRVLRDSFDYMQRSLVKYTEELKTTIANSERIESELRIARAIQMGMVPKIFPPYPDREDVDLYAMLVPAKEVGGDLYDFFIENEKLFFIIGDVSGKGIPASLVMAVTCRLFRTVASHASDPAEIVSSLNNSLSESNGSNMFCTFFLGILDLQSGELQYCNAGHNPPMVIAPDGVVKSLDVQPNIPLGVFRGFPYVTQKTQLDKGAVLFLYTDGVTEAESPTGELYSEKRLDEVLGHGACDAKGFIYNVKNSVDAYAAGAEQSDDITMLCLKYDVDSADETVFEKELHLTNDISEVAKLPLFVNELASEFDLSEEVVFNMNLVLEEAVTNVVMYSYPKGESGSVDLVAKCNGESVTFVLSDAGKPFDPTMVPETDVTLPAEERRIGGLGIFLIKQIMDTVEYRRNEGRNVLVMSKKLNNKINQ